MRYRERNRSTNLDGWYGEEIEIFHKDTGWRPYLFNKNKWSLPHYSIASISDVNSKAVKTPGKKRKRAPFTQVNPVEHTIQGALFGESSDTNWQEFTIGLDLYRRRYRYGGYSNQSSYVVSAYGWPNGWISDPSLLPHKEGADFLINDGQSTQMSLLNFIVELPDIKSTFAFLLAKGLKKISGGILSYKFGMEPLCDDVLTLVTFASAFEKKLEWLKRNSGQDVQMTFRKTLSRPNGYISIANGLRWRVLEWSHTYNAFARVKLDNWSVNYCYQKLKFFNQFYGTSKILSAIWEGIPFSFVIDWFTNFGELIGQLELPSELPPRLHGIGYSQKLSAKLALEYLLPGQVQQLGSHGFIRYSRQPGLPLSLEQAVDFHLPTGMQQGLLFTLIHQIW